MPRSFDYGDLSKLAVEVIVLSTLHRDVLPESICPSTPMLMLMSFYESTSESGMIVISSAVYSTIVFLLNFEIMNK